MRLLRAACAIDPRPVLLYELGRACDLAGDLDCAVEAYGRYLAASPAAPQRAGVFQTGPDNTGWVLVDPQQPLDSFQVAAITNEPAPGGDTPTGKILLQGGM